MSDFVTLSCPSCGGKLEITSEIDRFACAHCGTEHVVRRGGGLVSLKPVVESIEHVRTGVDKTASELAIRRLQEEIAALQQEKQRILTSPNQQGWSGTLFSVAAFFLVWLFLCAIVGESQRFGAFIGAAVVGIGVFVFFMVRLGQGNQDRAAPIEEQIALRQAEIQRHQDIVSR